MLGEPIPINEVVGDFYLKKVTYKSTKDYEGMEFSFVRRGSWINLLVTNPEKIPDKELLEKRRYRAALKIESIASIFLDEETMRECFRSATSFESFAKSIIEGIEKTPFKTTELELKTLPGPKVGFVVPFARKVGDSRRPMSYTEFELQILDQC